MKSSTKKNHHFIKSEIDEIKITFQRLDLRLQLLKFSMKKMERRLVIRLGILAALSIFVSITIASHLPIQ